MDYEGLHNVIPPEHLPEQYGGQLPSLQDYAASSLFPELPPLEPKIEPSQECQPKTEETKALRTGTRPLTRLSTKLHDKLMII